MAPFGGVKQSGLGREGSKYGIDEYLEVSILPLSNYLPSYSVHVLMVSISNILNVIMPFALVAEKQECSTLASCFPYILCGLLTLEFSCFIRIA